jgi:hypothetical protein
MSEPLPLETESCAPTTLVRSRESNLRTFLPTILLDHTGFHLIELLCMWGHSYFSFT